MPAAGVPRSDQPTVIKESARSSRRGARLRVHLASKHMWTASLLVTLRLKDGLRPREGQRVAQASTAPRWVCAKGLLSLASESQPGLPQGVFSPPTFFCSVPYACLGSREGPMSVDSAKPRDCVQGEHKIQRAGPGKGGKASFLAARPSLGPSSQSNPLSMASGL